MLNYLNSVRLVHGIDFRAGTRKKELIVRVKWTLKFEHSSERIFIPFRTRVSATRFQYVECNMHAKENHILRANNNNDI